MEIRLYSGRVVKIKLLIDECRGPVDVYQIGQVKVEHTPLLKRIWIRYLSGQEPKSEPWRYADHKTEAARLINEFKRFLFMPIEKAALCSEEHGGSETPQKSKNRSEYINFTPLWITEMKAPIIRKRRHDHDPLRKPGDFLCVARTKLTPEQIQWLDKEGYHDSCHICQMNRNEQCVKACKDPLVTSKINIFERKVKEVAVV